MPKRKPSLAADKLRPIVGHLVWVSAMLFCGLNAEPIPLTWRGGLCLCAFALLIAYTAYHCGWINGHHAGWIKARDEYEPNTEIDEKR